VRVETDWRDQVRPGFKFNDWELKGVPIRLEIGPRDAAADQVVAARRDTGKKETIRTGDVPGRLAELLDAVQSGLYEQARAFLEEHISSAETWDELRAILDAKSGFVWVNWCDSKECEQALAGLKATVRAIPLDEDEAKPDGPCVCCGRSSRFRCIVARSY
jgi:prolyl-tRNA synthetase